MLVFVLLIAEVAQSEVCKLSWSDASMAEAVPWHKLSTRAVIAVGTAAQGPLDLACRTAPACACRMCVLLCQLLLSFTVPPGLQKWERHAHDGDFSSSVKTRM